MLLHRFLSLGYITYRSRQILLIRLPDVLLAGNVTACRFKKSLLPLNIHLQAEGKATTVMISA